MKKLIVAPGLGVLAVFLAGQAAAQALKPGDTFSDEFRDGGRRPADGGDSRRQFSDGMRVGTGVLRPGEAGTHRNDLAAFCRIEV